MTGETAPELDLILVGGGLANGLIAYRIAQKRPETKILVLESGQTFGGNHTWSFHDLDLSSAQRAWTDPFVVRRWPFYHVAFPNLRRRVDLSYCSANSDRFHEVLRRADIPVRFGARVESVSPRQVRLETGAVLEARAVIDGRGAAPTPLMRLGWQKFLGQEIRTEQPHRLTGPILMDAAVEQHDGYRFVYVLPFAADRLLIEDTYYSERPELDAALLRDRIAEYAHANGWIPAELVREETGVLPITLAGDFDAFWSTKRGQCCAGLRAGLFHPTTGFSWPDAVRLADCIAALPQLDADPLFAATRAYAAERWRTQAFFRGLNRMLFLAGEPSLRWVMMRHFYRLPEPLIARFYRGALLPWDKVQLLVGRPPVTISGAVRALFDTAVAGA